MRPIPLLAVCALACGPQQPPPPVMTYDPPDIPDQPVKGLDEMQFDIFSRGDELFDLDLRDGDGLGPLYTHKACGQCHDGAARRPRQVHKITVVMAHGV
jgi:hypothetical protein